MSRSYDYTEIDNCDLDNLIDASRALLDWARENTGPHDPNSPHALLVALQAALAAMKWDDHRSHHRRTLTNRTANPEGIPGNGGRN